MKKSKLVLSNPDILVKINEAALALALTELQFTLSPDEGFAVNKLDSAKAAHLKILLMTSDFESYSVPDNRIVCIDMDGFTTVVGRLKRLKEPIEIVIGDSEMIFANLGKPRREFTINLLNPAEQGKELMSDFPTKVVVDVEEMNEQVKDLSGIASHAVVQIVDGLLTVQGEGEKGKVSIQTSLTELGLVKSHEGPNARAMYAIGYLFEAFKFLKANKFETVKLCFTDDKPITLTTELGEGEIRILIAPRVERR